MRVLTAIPVYNEQAHLEPVLAEVLRYAGDVLVVDDGSTDRTPDLLRNYPAVQVIRHETNRGYGAGLRTAFRRTLEAGYDGLVTIDCDGQHEPALISCRGAGTCRSSTPRSALPRNGAGSTSR
jgi:glycosyltransferase involved in cell wall biosynthesis